MYIAIYNIKQEVCIFILFAYSRLKSLLPANKKIKAPTGILTDLTPLKQILANNITSVLFSHCCTLLL